MKKTNQFTLQQYSGLAGALLLMHGNTSAQAVYTDVEPDVSLQYDGEYFFIDMDNDGNNDFFLLKASHYFTDTFYSIYRFNHVIKAGPNFNPENSIAGIYATNGEGGGTTYFPYALNAGDPINGDLSFQYGHYQLMGIGFYDVDETPWEWHYYIGSWTPSIDSMYLGVRFLGADACKHYGWIRCSTVDSARTLIVHDFAYETKCNTPMIAGDTIGDTSVSVNEYNQLDGTIYAFNSDVYITLNVIPASCKVRITDVSGGEIYAAQITSNFTVLPFMNKPKGFYIVELFSDKQRIAVRKIIIN